MMLDYFIFLNLLALVCSAGILKQADVNVSLGEDATFSCKLPGAVGVKQVTWQQHREDGTLQSMVSFTEHSQPQVDEAFIGKVNVTVASILMTTIVLKKVTFADETCYVCTFSVYPSGTERETACLTIQGLSDISSQIVDNPKEKNMVVSCSATGKPTPVISWWSGEKTELSSDLSESFNLQNEDGTVTTTSNLTIPHSRSNAGYVTCMAKSGGTERTVNITVDKQIDTGSPVTSRYYIISAVVMISCFAVVSSIVLLHQRRKNRDKHVIELA